MLAVYPKTPKIGNNIHTVALLSCTCPSMGFMRPYQTILRVAGHKYAHMINFCILHTDTTVVFNMRRKGLG